MVNQKLFFIANLMIICICMIACSGGGGGGGAAASSTSSVAVPNISYSGSVVGTVNSAITPKVPTNSGDAVSSCSINPTLPTGLSLASDCRIFGTPTTTASVATYTATATNSAGSATASIQITVNAALAAPVISYSGSVTTVVNSAITSVSPTNSGGAIASCSISPALPTGLSISSACVISGTPTVVSSVTSYTISATNAAGTGTNTISITVNSSGPTLSAISPNHGIKSGGTTVTLTGTGFAAGATVAIGGVSCGTVNVVSSTSLTCISGAIVTASAVGIMVTVSGQSASLSNAFTYYDALAISPSTKTLAVNNTTTFSASGGYGSYTYLVVTAGGGSFSGALYTAPASAGTYTVKVMDADSNQSSATVTVNPGMAIGPNPATVIVSSSTTFFASGGVQPYVFTTNNGTIGSTSGAYTAPVSPGSAIVTATDAIGNSVNASVTINLALSISPITKTLVYGASFVFTAAGGIPPYTWTATNPSSILSTTATSCTYQPPSISGMTTLTLKDSVNTSVSATITSVPPLSITPTISFLITGESATVSGAGGISGYSYSDTLGYVNSSTGVLSVPLSAPPASNTVTVTDSQSSTSSEIIAIRAFQTKDQFQYQANYDTYSSQIAVDSLGNIFSVGFGNDSLGKSHWVVRKSSNGGSSWSTVDDWQNVSGHSAAANGIVIDSSNNIFVVGNGNDVSNVAHWTVRKSTNNGVTWTSIDDYSAYALATPYGIGIDTANNLYVVGTGQDAVPSTHWLVRKGSSGGAWATIDDYQSSVGQNAYAKSITITPGNNYVYVNGYANNAGGVNTWVARLSGDGGATWSNINTGAPSYYGNAIAADSTIHTYALANPVSGGGGFFYKFTGLNVTTLTYPSAGLTFSGQSIALDSAGSIYIAGYANEAGIQHMVLLKSKDGGTSWVLIDDLQPGPSSQSYKGIFIDSASRVYMVASAFISNHFNWLSRILSP